MIRSLLLFLSSHFQSSGAKIVLRLASLRATRLQAVPTQLILRRRARTFLSMVVGHKVVQCHPQVSGTGGSCSIETSNLMRGQDPAPADNLSRSSSKPLATLACLTSSRCSSQAALVATAAVLPNSHSGASLLRQHSTRMALADTRAKHPVCQDLFCSALCPLLFRHACLLTEALFWIALISGHISSATRSYVLRESLLIPLSKMVQASLSYGMVGTFLVGHGLRSFASK